MTPCGTTYDWEPLVRWIQSHGTYPMGECAGPLRLGDLAPNLALRNIIEDWAAAVPPPAAVDDVACDEAPAPAPAVAQRRCASPSAAAGPASRRTPRRRPATSPARSR